MRLTYRCLECAAAVQVPLDEGSGVVTCPHCHASLPLTPGSIQDGRLVRCAACPSTDLFVRKDFPQRWGVTIVVIGFASSCVAWYFHRLFLTFGILLATALVDVILYSLVADAVECYRCHAVYRGVANPGVHPPFQLQTRERYRQQEARLRQRSHPPRGTI